MQVGGNVVTKPGTSVADSSKIKLTVKDQYVSRAALKLAGTAEDFGLDFKDRSVLDVGSSTGGFTDYALRHGAKKVIAVDVGTDQLHSSLRSSPKVVLHEKTDIRGFELKNPPDIVLVDVSFISLREILPGIAKLSGSSTQIVALLKPQFEAGRESLNRGVIKNDKLRRNILRDFEIWSKKYFAIVNKSDSEVSGAHGNVERFYLLRKL